jgi:hypothetical protein
MSSLISQDKSDQENNDGREEGGSKRQRKWQRESHESRETNQSTSR